MPKPPVSHNEKHGSIDNEEIRMPVPSAVTSSLWIPETVSPSYPSLQGEALTDIAIVGGGITGVTTALLLARAGIKVSIVEGATIGAGVSGLNSGHLTSLLLDMRYSEIERDFGAENARLAAESQMTAIDMVEDFVKILGIDCGFKRLSGYLYAEKMGQVKALGSEFLAAQKAGLPVAELTTIPLPFQVKSAFITSQQARFHPYHYVRGMLAECVRLGVTVYENASVQTIQTGRPVKSRPPRGSWWPIRSCWRPIPRLGCAPSFRRK